MNKEEIKIITLGDIFRNLETEEQAFEFLKYIKNLQQENKKQKELIDKAVLELANIDGNLSNSQLSDRICNLIDILNEVSE